MNIYMIFPDDGNWKEECVKMRGGFKGSVESDLFSGTAKISGAYYMVEWGPDE